MYKFRKINLIKLIAVTSTIAITTGLCGLLVVSCANTSLTEEQIEKDKETKRVNYLIDEMEVVQNEGKFSNKEVLSALKSQNFDIFNNPYFVVTPASELKFYNLEVQSSTLTTLQSIKIVFKISSTEYPEVFRTKVHLLTNLFDDSSSAIDEQSKILKKYMEDLILTRKTESTDIDVALTKINASDFNFINNNVFAINIAIDQTKFSIDTSATKMSNRSLAIEVNIYSLLYSEFCSETKTYVLEFEDKNDPKVIERNKLNSFVNLINFSLVDSTMTVETAVDKINTVASFKILNNDVFVLSPNAEAQAFDFRSVTATRANDNSITLQFSVYSKTYGDIYQRLNYQISGFANPVSGEQKTLNTLLKTLTVTKNSASDLTVDQSMVIIQASNFNAFSNDIIVISNQTEIKNYSYTITITKISEVSINVSIKLTSKTISSISGTENYIVAGFKGLITDETNKLNTLLNKITITKNSAGASLTVKQALDTIAAGGFNAFSNNVFNISNQTEITTGFTYLLTANRIDDTTIEVNLQLTSKTFSTVFADRDFTLSGFNNQEILEQQRLNALLEVININKINTTLTAIQALAEISKSAFDLYSNTIFSLTPANDAKVFDIVISNKVIQNTNNIWLTLKITSKLYSSISANKEFVLTNFVTNEVAEQNKLNALMPRITISKQSANNQTVASAVTEINTPGFDIHSNAIFTIAPSAEITEFNTAIIAARNSDTEISLKLTLTSKSFPSVTLNKSFALSGFNNLEILEQQKLSALMNNVAMRKINTTLSAVQALAEINKTGFDVYTNTIFELTPVSDVKYFNVVISNKVIENSDNIRLTLKFTSKTYSAVTVTKDFTLTAFISESVLETTKLTNLMAKISITKQTSSLTSEAAVSLINTTGFNIFTNSVFTITPADEIKAFNSSVIATINSDTEISLKLTLTSKTFAAVTQNKNYILSGFTAPTLPEGVQGTGINKIYVDANIGTVYVGTAANYNIGGKKFYGDDYSRLNPFQDYGSEELALMQANPTWPQIKQLVASSRPVSGTPDLSAYLPAAGTSITFTDAIKTNVNIPNNVKRFISIVNEQQYNETFYYRNAVYSYRDFITAIAKYPRILAEVNLDASFIKNNVDLQNKSGVLVPEKALAYVAKLEIATMFSHFMQETGAGMGSTATEALIKANRPKQIPWNSNYNASYVEPTSSFTNLDIVTAATGTGVTLANQTEMTLNPTKKLSGTEKQALYWVTEASYITNDTSEAARLAYTSWNLTGAPWTAAAFPPPIGADEISTVSYIGRGAKQLSWNYNYGPASRVFFGDDDAEVLLNNPSRVAKEGWLAIGTAIMFYMTPSGNKPSMHDAITGAWEPSAEQASSFKWKPGFGISINIINGAYEIIANGNESNQTYQALNRQFFFSQNAKNLGILNFVSSSYFDNAGYGQTLFSTATSVPTVSTNWTVSWLGAPAPSLASWDTGAGFKVNFPGDYYRAWKAYQNSTFIADWKITGLADAQIVAVKSADWKAGKNPSYTKVGKSYDWFSK